MACPWGLGLCRGVLLLVSVGNEGLALLGLSALGAVLGVRTTGATGSKHEATAF